MAAKPSMLSRAADAVLPKKVIRLITYSGDLLDSFEIPPSKDWPTVVIFGIADAEKTFIRDKRSGDYVQASHCHSPMPPQSAPPFSGRTARRA